LLSEGAWYVLHFTKKLVADKIRKGMQSEAGELDRVLSEKSPIREKTRVAETLKTFGKESSAAKKKCEWILQESHD